MISLRIRYRNGDRNIDMDFGHIEHMAPDDVDDLIRIVGAVREDLIKTREGNE